MPGNTESIGYIRKKFHKLHDLIYTSYHEAGHAVYGALHGIKLQTVSIFEIKKTKRVEGFVQYNADELSDIKDPDLFQDRLLAELGMQYAGLVAEKRFLKTISGSDKFPMFLKEGSSNDLSEAALLIEKYNLAESGRKRYNYKQKFMRQVDHELLDHWDAVILVAHGLVKKKKLNLSDLKELLCKKSDDREFWKNKFKIIEELHNNVGALDEKEMKSILSL